MEQSRNKLAKSPLIYSILLHVILLTALFLHWSNNTSHPNFVQPDVNIIKAVAVNPNQISSSVDKIKTVKQDQGKLVAKNTVRQLQPAVQTPPTPQPPVPEKPAQTSITETQQQEIAKQLAQNPPVKKPKPIIIEKPQEDENAKFVAEKQKEQQKIQKQQQLKQEQQKQEQLKQAQLKQEKIKQQELAKKQALAKKQQLAQQIKIAQQEDLQKQLEQEQKQLSDTSAKQMQSEIEKYMALIEQAIHQNWLLPDGVDSQLSCVLLIKTAPGGEVISVQVTKSSGNAGLDNSARTAVFKASPLPVPSGDLYEQFHQFNLTVKP